MARLAIAHVVALAKGGSDDEENLWLAGPICNGHQGDKTEARDLATGARVALFNPRTQVWMEHVV